MLPLNSKDFSKEIPLLQLVWSSNSLGTLKTCPRKYFYEKVCGWRKKKSSFHLEFGGFYADAVELYHIRISKGDNHDEATLAAVRCVLENGTRDDAGVFTPWDTEDPNKNRGTLVRAVVWYLEKFKDDPCKTITFEDGKPAVELAFRFGTGAFSPNGEEYEFHGYLDRFVKFGEDNFINDNKTTKSALSDYYFKQFNPNNQMSLYTLAGVVVFQTVIKGVIIDAAQLAVGFARFGRSFSTRTQTQLAEWTKHALIFIKQAEAYAIAAQVDADPESCYPMNDTSCDKYGGCPFRDICSASPDVRKLYLSSDFEQRIYEPKKLRNIE